MESRVGDEKIKEDRGRVYTKLRFSFVYGAREHSTNAASLLIAEQSIRDACVDEEHFRCCL